MASTEDLTSKSEPLKSVDGDLPSRLPADLGRSIAHILSPASPESDNRTTPDEPTSLTAQLAELFSDPSDLSPKVIEQKQAHLRRGLARQDKHIETLVSQLVQRQASDTSDSTNDVQDKIDGLLKQLVTIRKKAHKSEEVVREITRDIRMLDTCKRNVVTSMTALKRLQMLGM